MTTPDVHLEIPPPTAEPAPVAPTGRLAGIDLARSVALFGMFAVHLGGIALFATADSTGGAVSPPGVWSFSGIFEGRAMPLFVLLSGIGLTLLLRSSGGRPAAVLGRAAALLVLGLVLSGPTAVVVILHFYALYLVVGLVAHRLGDRALLALAVAVAVVGVAVQVRQVMHGAAMDAGVGGSSPVFGRLGDLAHPGRLLETLLVTGGYPLLPDGAFFLVGMWLGRRRLSGARAALRLVVAGVLLTVAGAVFAAAVGAVADSRHPRSASVSDSQAGGTLGTPTTGTPSSKTPSEATPVTPGGAPAGAGPGRKVFDGPAPGALDQLRSWGAHSHMPPWLLESTGTSLVVLGLCVLAARRERRLRPATALGRLTLTAYVAHLLFLRWAGTTWWAAHPALATVALWVVLAGFAVAWTRWSRTGPAEHVVRAAGQLTARAVDAVRRGRGSP